MKHIMMYEAFASKTISKTLSFLGSEININQKKKFLAILNNIRTKYDLPIDLIDDKWMSYLTKKNALLLRNKESVTNDKEIAYLKFWFSLENGYLGYTGVGNKTFSKDSGKKNAKFTASELKYIIDNNILDDYRGKLIPINISEVKHLDPCVLYCSNSIDEDYLTKATIWIEDDKVYAIQDRFDGSAPDYNSDVWRRFGRRSWALGTFTRYGNDSAKLHKYIKDDKPLRVVTSLGEEAELEDPLDFNLPLDSSGRLTYWGNQSSIDNEQRIEKADFAIVLNFDEMVNSVNKVSTKKTYRKESKVGATSLLSNEDIRKVNIDRYIGGVLKGLGLSDNLITLNNLQKVILMKLQGDLGLISCIYGKSLEDFLSSLSEFIRVSNESGYSSDTIKRKYDELLREFKSIYNHSLKVRPLIIKNISDIIKYYEDESNDDLDARINPRLEILEILKKTFDIGRKITDNVSNMKIDNLTDLKIIHHKIKSIRNIAGDESEFEIGVIDRLRHLSAPDILDDITSRLNRTSTTERKDIMTSLDNLDRYVNSIFK